MKILELAQRVQRKYGTNNPSEILSALGVKVFYIPMSGVRGIYKRIERNTIVFADSDLDERDTQFVLGHELGHHLLHRGENRVFLDRCTYAKTSVQEHEADLFSVCLMAPYPCEVLSEQCTVDTVACLLGVRHDLAEAYIQEAEPMAGK